MNVQLLQVIVLAFTLVTQCVGVSAVAGQLSFPGTKKEPINLGEVSATQDNSKESRKIDVGSLEEVLEYSFSVPGPQDAVQHSFLLVGYPSLKQEFPFYPEIQQKEDGSKFSYNIKINHLPKALLSKSIKEVQPLDVSLVLVKEGAGKENLLKSVFQLKLNSSIPIDYTPPKRLGAENEIVHQFRGAPKSAPASISKLFVVIIGCVTVLLLISWLSVGALSTIKIPSGFQSLYFLALIGLLAGFEYAFAQYYWGTSIFDTLHLVGYLSAATLVIGTKFLRNFNR